MANEAKITLLGKNKTTRAVTAAIRNIKRLGSATKRVMSGANKAAIKATASIKRMGKVAGLAAVGGIAASVREAHLFAKSMAEVNTMVDKADIGKLSDDVRRLSGEFGLTKDELARGLYNVLSAGIPEENAIDFLATASKAAVAGVTDVNTSVDLLTTVLNAFGMKSSDVSSVADTLFTTVKLGKTTFSELAASFAQVAPIAAANGVAFEDVAAALATMTKQGTRTPQAITQLRSGILSTTKVLGDGWAESRTLSEAFKEISDMAGGSINNLKNMLGRVEAVNAVLALTGRNASMAASDVNKFAGKGGAMEAANEKMEKVRGWERLWESFRGIVTKFGTAINEAVLPYIESLAQWFRDIANNSTAFDALREGIKAFAEDATKKLKVVKRLLSDIFDKDKSLGAFGSLGKIILAAFQDGAAHLYNTLMPLMIKMGDIISDAIWRGLPGWMRDGKIPPSERVPKTKPKETMLARTGRAALEAHPVGMLISKALKRFDPFKKSEGAGGFESVVPKVQFSPDDFVPDPPGKFTPKSTSNLNKEVRKQMTDLERRLERYGDTGPDFNWEEYNEKQRLAKLEKARLKREKIEARKEQGRRAGRLAAQKIIGKQREHMARVEAYRKFSPHAAALAKIEGKDAFTTRGFKARDTSGYLTAREQMFGKKEEGKKKEQVAGLGARGIDIGGVFTRMYGGVGARKKENKYTASGALVVADEKLPEIE